MRYALPLIVPVALLAATAIDALGRRALTFAAATAVVVSLATTVPAARAYGHDGSPAFRVFAELPLATLRHPSPAAPSGAGCHVRDCRARDARLAAARRGVAARPPRHAGSPRPSRPRVARARRALAGRARRARALRRRSAPHRSRAVRSACQDARGLRALDPSGAPVPRRHPSRQRRRLRHAAAWLDARQRLGADRRSRRRHRARRPRARTFSRASPGSAPARRPPISSSAAGRWAARRPPG